MSEPVARPHNSGFTLIEVAVVIAIIGLLLGALLVPLATQVQATKIKATDKSLEEIREALLGFAITNGRLPCPDTGTDGIEDGGGAAVCNNQQGTLPYASLGVAPLDAWGRRYTYRVTAEFTRNPVPGSVCVAVPPDNRLGLCDVGDITISGRVTDPNVNDKVERNLGVASAAVVVSHGPNGLGGSDLNGVAMAAVAAGTDEAENANADAVFQFRSVSPPQGACSETDVAQPFCEFDDRVIWLSPNVLFNRLVTAGVLP